MSFTITADPAILREGDGGTTDVRFHITSLTGPLATPAELRWTWMGAWPHSANSADLILPTDARISVAAGAVTQDFIVQVVGDQMLEWDESFAIIFAELFQIDPSFPHWGYSYYSAVSVTILNDDLPRGPPLLLRGPHDGYLILGSIGYEGVVQDRMEGRDALHILVGQTQITFADGIGVFDPTGSAAEVAHLYQAALGRTADIAGLSFWTDLLDSGRSDLAGVARLMAATDEATARFGGLDDEAFVRLLYQDTLGREGGSGELAYWTGRLGAEASRAEVLLGFSESTEHILQRLHTIGDDAAAEAWRLYHAALDRAPDAAGLAYWTAQLKSGTAALQVATGFAASAEFAQTHAGADHAGLVTQLYASMLDRAPDAEGLQFWVAQLDDGLSDGALLLALSDSMEHRAATADATHDGWVFLGG
ncbi:uncharacterized protein DUF4214 [Humitalea rosea]|uniref:Uncharacterized protein DUF4214 n=1 Tax=Humitalea rosea TaxID=990373 RepID=A0A2W7J8A1_9PROT|nr:DUF4214 domain-containing protein [Humitalea rosea]PZW48013.1 uncharacterized protein DUF4214 [Humitalea rosea]